jgi:hypothetical protein
MKLLLKHFVSVFDGAGKQTLFLEMHTLLQAYVQGQFECVCSCQANREAQDL